MLTIESKRDMVSYMQSHGEAFGKLCTWVGASIGVAYQYVGVRVADVTHYVWDFANENSGAIGVVVLLSGKVIDQYFKIKYPNRRNKNGS